MPDGLNYVAERPKSRKMNQNSNAKQRPANAETSSVGLKIENVMEICLMREPFFGEIQ